MHFRIGNAIGLSALLFPLTLCGCYHMSGKITDARTGEPIADARVGVIVVSQISIVGNFHELARTNSRGNYRFLHGQSRPWVSVRADNYLTVEQSIEGAPDLTFDAALQPIDAIKGTWDVMIDVDGELVPAGQFTFDELHMEWHTDDSSFGEIDYAFDGDEIVIDSLLGAGDVAYGQLATTLMLDGSGDTMSGTIEYERVSLDVDCRGECTVVAVRPAP